MKRFSGLAIVVVFFGVCAGKTFAGADLSTPKAAALTFAKAMEAGDASAAKSAALSDSENQELVTILAGMIAGFAMVAYPDAYGQSGVMTFIVSNHGKVYEKDLGRNTAAIAAKMGSFEPGTGWKEVAP
jgi:hypothetical protein